MECDAVLPVEGVTPNPALDDLTAASRSGGAHRGNLAVLIRYWTVGRGLSPAEQKSDGAPAVTSIAAYADCPSTFLRLR